MDRPEASSSSGKRKWTTGSNEKKPSPTCFFYDNKHKKVGNSDPFASRDHVTKFDSPDYGSATKVIERFFSLRKTILTRFPPPSRDLANLKDRSNSLNVNDTNISTRYLVDDNKHKKVVDFSDPFALRDYVTAFDSPAYGSVTKDVEHLLAMSKMMSLTRFPSRGDFVNLKARDQGSLNVNDTKEVIVISSDDDDDNDDDNDETKHPMPFQLEPNVVASNNLFEQFPGTSVMVHGNTMWKSFGDESKSLAQICEDENKSDIDGQVSTQKCSGKDNVQSQAFIVGGVTTTSDPIVEKEKSIEDNNVAGHNDKSIEDDEVESEDDNSTEDEDDVMVEEDESDSQSDIDPNEDIWNEMQIGLESSKEINPVPDQKPSEDEQECDHSYILKDDIGYVCRVRGMVQTPIDSIIEFQHPKTSKSIRTYYYEGQNNNSGDASLDGVKLTETDFTAHELTVHPRHKIQMKPHQVEGFNFLLSNLVSDNPGGCILAHAPGSGKTFLLISFIQSFMAKYPDARPLVVLPRGILGTWKKEFIRWQVEDILLLDMYSAKADGRVQQLEVLKQWANQRSILFLGYQQFSSIACNIATTPASISCQDLLINRLSLLILDEGHTPRNKETNVFTALDKVKPPMKVVLSGTLFQNHVTEVFNILNLVRPKFLKMEKSKAIKGVS